jgi:hypothetical protein
LVKLVEIQRMWQTSQTQYFMLLHSSDDGATC